jgi:hypothetical protein
MAAIFGSRPDITPDYEDGKHIGYMAVRKKATRQQIDAVEPLYKRFKRR